MRHHLSRRAAHQAVLAGVICGVVQTLLAASAQAPRMPRVRSNSPAIRAVIDQATERSVTFRRLVDTIDRTDGLVYVDEGRCNHSVRACLMLSVKVAGPYRLLWIAVDARKAPGAELMASIGHELQHAVEVLSDPAVTDNHAMFFFYHHRGSGDTGRFETKAAIDAGLDVLAEVRAHSRGR
jgi:hypothetical protein